jgi:hypothetical protein
MSRKNHEMLDRTADQVRTAQPDPEEIRRAADRVWARLATEGAAAPATTARTAAPIESIAGCDDYQSLIPALLAGELPAPRRLLLEDHTRECVPCRRAQIAARPGRPANAGRRGVPPWSTRGAAGCRSPRR